MTKKPLCVLLRQLIFWQSDLITKRVLLQQGFIIGQTSLVSYIVPVHCFHCHNWSVLFEFREFSHVTSVETPVKLWRMLIGVHDMHVHRRHVILEGVICLRSLEKGQYIDFGVIDIGLYISWF